MEKKHEKFSTEWRKHMNRFSKSDLIHLLKRELIRNDKLIDVEDILFSKLEADVHPYEWVSALLSDYKTLREQIGIETDDPDAESIMIYKVASLVKKAHDIRMKNEHQDFITNLSTQVKEVEENPFKL